MGLIKKKDAKSYFATKNSKHLRRVVSASKPDPITKLSAEDSTGAVFADTVEAQRSELLMAEKTSSRITGTQNSKIALVHSANKSAGV